MLRFLAGNASLPSACAPPRAFHFATNEISQATLQRAYLEVPLASMRLCFHTHARSGTRCKRSCTQNRKVCKRESERSKADCTTICTGTIDNLPKAPQHTQAGSEQKRKLCCRLLQDKHLSLLFRTAKLASGKGVYTEGALHEARKAR